MVYNPQEPECKVKVRIILDNGSECIFLTEKLNNTFRLSKQDKKKVSMKTVELTDERPELENVVAHEIELNWDPDLFCQLSLCLCYVNHCNKCLSGLRPADYSARTSRSHSYPHEIWVRLFSLWRPRRSTKEKSCEHSCLLKDAPPNSKKFPLKVLKEC